MPIKWTHLPIIVFLGVITYGWFRIQSDIQPNATATDKTSEWNALIQQADYNAFDKPVVSALTQRYNGRSSHPSLVDFVSRMEQYSQGQALDMLRAQNRDIDATIIKALGSPDGTVATAALAYLCTLKTKHLQLLYQQLSTTENKQTEFLGTLALGCLASPYAEEALLPLENSPKPHVAKAVTMAFQRKGLFGK